ncbi:MAG TPA: adenylate/guanylate cyclase domain-containing protein [Candidatus Limnocylindria bacterium]|nr:adenylate/guanylate cyclase domain-containing protein [Candidatus Limnocylindria bacterium]
MTQGVPATLLPGWDRRRRWSLQFVDNEVERAFQAGAADPARRRLVLNAVANVPVWIVGTVAAGLFIPGVFDRPIWLMAVGQCIGLAAGGIWALRGSRSRRAVDGVYLVLDLTGGLALVAMTVIAGLFESYAAFLLLFTAVNALAVQRVSFIPSVVAVIGQLAMFTIAGIAIGLAALPFQFVLLASAFGVLVAGNYMVEDSERREFAQGRLIAALHRQVDDLLHRYLEPGVVDSIIADPTRGELGGVQMEVSVMFADLTGFTAFSDRVEPTEAVALLNKVFAAAVPVVREAGGTIVQFAGDAMMVIWNAPHPQPDHACLAARAAIGLQRATAHFADDPAHPRFRVGLNTGLALVGNIGTAELKDFSAIGDTTNLAARLQSFADPGSIVIGPRTRELIGDAATVRDLGEHQLKGKAATVHLYELLEMSGA